MFVDPSSNRFKDLIIINQKNNLVFYNVKKLFPEYFSSNDPSQYPIYSDLQIEKSSNGNDIRSFLDENLIVNGYRPFVTSTTSGNSTYNFRIVLGPYFGSLLTIEIQHIYYTVNPAGDQVDEEDNQKTIYTGANVRFDKIVYEVINNGAPTESLDLYLGDTLVTSGLSPNANEANLSYRIDGVGGPGFLEFTLKNSYYSSAGYRIPVEIYDDLQPDSVVFRTMNSYEANFEPSTGDTEDVNVWPPQDEIYLGWGDIADYPYEYSALSNSNMKEDSSLDVDKDSSLIYSVIEDPNPDFPSSLIRSFSYIKPLSEDDSELSPSDPEWNPENYQAQFGEDLLYGINILSIPYDGYEIDASLIISYDNVDIPFEEARVEIEKLKFFIAPIKSNNFDVTEKACIPLNDNTTTFMMARANPAIYGNAKIVIDSSGNLFLDSFKSSDIFNRNYYRKISISADGKYPEDLKMAFGSLPKGEFFKVPSKSLDPTKAYTSFDNQFDTRYEYGAENNDDFLYKENMRILAPLYISKEIPDFFAIFRVPEAYNVDSYNSVLNDTSIMNHFLRDGRCIKVFDLRKSTAIGQYIRNYANSISSQPDGIFLQFKEQDNADSSNFISQGKNTWYGISMNKGVFTSMTETSYFFNRTINSSEGGLQEDLDGFLVNGYQRNNLVGSRVLNLEWMFNDEESETYSMNMYFGLYLKENDFLHYEYITKDYSGSRVTFEKYDENNELIDDSFMRDLSTGVLSNDNYKDRLFFAITNENAQRIQNTRELDSFLSREVANHPDVNLFHLKSSKLDFSSYCSFINMHFTHPIPYGDHLRIILPRGVNTLTGTLENVILEIVASNDERLADEPNQVFPYIAASKRIGDNSENNIVFRTSISYLNFRENPLDTNDVNVFPLDSSIYHGFSDEDIDDYPFENEVYYNSEPHPTKPLRPNDAYAPELLGSLQDSSANPMNSAVYRVTFYTQDLNDHSQLADIDTQLFRISKALERYGIGIRVGSYQDGKLSILSNYSNIYFQHISNDILNVNLINGIDTFLDYEASSIRDYIHYFDDSVDASLYPLNYDPWKYSEEYQMFSVYNFEILGWRMSNIIPFINFNQQQNYYSLSMPSSLEERIKPLMLALNADRTYQPFLNIDVSLGWLRIRQSIMTGEHENELRYDLDKTNITWNPYNVAERMILNKQELYLKNSYLDIYSAVKCDIALMGIFPFKDLDFTLNLKEETSVKSDNDMVAQVGQRIYFNNTDGNLYDDTLYQLVSGAFEEISITPNTNFIVHQNYIYFDNKCTLVRSGYLTVSTEVRLRSISDKGNYYNYNYSNPYKTTRNFHINRDLSLALKYPLATPTNCIWKSNGTYYNGDSRLNIRNIKNSNYQSNLKASEGHFAESNNKLGNYSSNQYIIDDIESYVSNGKSIRDCILKKNPSNSIMQFLARNSQIQFATAYYNQYVNSLDFVWAGLNFSFRFESNTYNKNIKISNYDSYRVFVLNDYVSHMQNEIFFSEPEKIILVINHNFKWPDIDPETSILRSINNNLTNRIPYSWAENEYYIDFSSAFGSNQDIYVPLSEGISISLDDDEILVELDLLESIEDNIYASGDPYYCYFNNLKLSPKQYNGYVSLLYDNVYYKYMNTRFPSDDNILSLLDWTISYDALNINELSGFLNKSSYTIKNNPFYSNTTENKRLYAHNPLDAYIESFNYAFKVWLIPSSGDYMELDSNADSELFSFNLSKPNYIKYVQGFFVPNVRSLIEFETREDSDLERTLGCNFTMGNTKLSNISKIKSYIGNKVFDSSSISDITNYYTYERSIMSSSWDKSFYSLYMTNTLSKNMNGYEIGIDDKSFFGSKCLVLNDDADVIIRKWDYESNIVSISPIYSDYNTKSSAIQGYSVRINLTLAFYSYFINNQSNRLSQNWTPFVSNTNTYINNYIKLTLSRYYKIDDKKSFVLYKKDNVTNGTLDFILNQPEDFSDTNTWQACSNFKSSYSRENNEVILTLTILEYANSQYYPVLNLDIER